MSTDDSQAFLHYDHKGNSHYFCSEHCLRKFKEHPEYTYMRTRFIVAPILTVPLVIIAMRDILPGGRAIEELASVRVLNWAESILSTPVVLS